MIGRERLEACVKAVREKTAFVPETAVVLGSGLGAFADRVEGAVSVEYGELPDFPVSTVPGHRGRFVFGTVAGAPVAVMQGRVHLYEGYSSSEVVFPLLVLHALGARRVILTNAAGGMGEGLEQGDLMLLTDHISSFVPSPLIGPNEDSFGPRFPDMTEVYSRTLREKAKRAAGELGISLKEGVYVQVTGPQYETPAEIRMYRRLGADAVGMSTVCEALCARYLGMEVCGLSCITNLAAGLGNKQLSHKEVQETADRMAVQFQSLLVRFLELKEEQ